MNLIVAVDRNWAIGNNGDQLVYIKDDLKRFKNLTIGHTIIFGRKTLSTFPRGSPLSGRRNFILSRDKSLKIEGAQVYSDIKTLLQDAPNDSFVIGGESVYKLLLDYCETAYVTFIDNEYEADTWFPDLSKKNEWKLTKEEKPFLYKNVSCKYQIWENIKNCNILQ